MRGYDEPFPVRPAPWWRRSVAVSARDVALGVAIVVLIVLYGRV